MKRLLSTIAALGFVAAAYPAAAIAQSAPSISVNGSPVTFDQPPIERAGRVYVPLRGVFEHLGASVVFSNGLINATRGGTTVSLTIGNATATVNGAQQQLDSPPFVVGARTLVPLRFVAQALGANVSYDASSNAVAITQPQPAIVITPVPTRRPLPPMPPAPPPQSHAIVVLPLVRMQPPNGSVVSGMRPDIAATFPTAIRPDDVRIRLDGRDVTGASYVSDRTFSFDPPFDVPYGTHRLQIDGRLAGGDRFNAEQTFENRPVEVANYLRDITPPNGARVGFAFTIRGATRPGSVVRIVATTSDRLPFGESEQASNTGDVTAGPNGVFERNIALDDHSGNIIDVRITSRAPDGAISVAIVHLRP
jgi:hypothetical protein